MSTIVDISSKIVHVIAMSKEKSPFDYNDLDDVGSDFFGVDRM